MLQKRRALIAIIFNGATECRHGDIQCGQCAQDWQADGEGIGPIIPRHDRAQAGAMPEATPIVSNGKHAATQSVIRTDTQD